jgi:hypothetical protein
VTGRQYTPYPTTVGIVRQSEFKLLHLKLEDDH